MLTFANVLMAGTFIAGPIVLGVLMSRPTRSERKYARRQRVLLAELEKISVASKQAREAEFGLGEAPKQVRASAERVSA